MKIAIILLGTPGEQYHRDTYLRACIKKAERAEQIIINPDSYEMNKYFTSQAYLNKLERIIARVYIFTDFGMDTTMNLAEKKFTAEGKEVITIELTDAEKATILKKPELKAILLEVCERTGIPVGEITKKTRKREVVEARQIFCMRAKDKTHHSLGMIGLMIGKDHATVLHALKTVTNVRELQEKYLAVFECKTMPLYTPAHRCQ